MEGISFELFRRRRLAGRSGDRAARRGAVRAGLSTASWRPRGCPQAYGRTVTWAPCGYTPTQLRDAYGATQSGLTGAGTIVAVLSEAADTTALSDANHWSREQGIPQFAAGQFEAYIVSNSGFGSDVAGLQYPSSDPWLTAMGGTSLAIGAGDDYQSQGQMTRVLINSHDGHGAGAWHACVSGYSRVCRELDFRGFRQRAARRLPRPAGWRRFPEVLAGQREMP